VQTETRNAKDTLIQFFEAMARRDSTFYERFASLPLIWVGGGIVGVCLIISDVAGS
jgi:hypothetical protein